MLTNSNIVRNNGICANIHIAYRHYSDINFLFYACRWFLGI